jgi:NTE family protein
MNLLKHKNTDGAKIGLVLSGGGARCAAHLGVLQALEEFGIKPSVISGTSAGAIAGAFYAAGYPAKEILDIIQKGHFFSFSNLLIRKQGFFSMNGFENIYKQYFPNNSFSDLQFPLYVAATDILKGELVYFSSGNLSQSLLASSCIPIVFQPVSYQNTLFVDGGVMNNFPVEPLKNKCDIIIGVHVNSIQKEINEIHMNDIIDRSFHLAMSNSMQNKIDQCDVYIEPPDMSQFSIFDLSKSQEIYEYGYRYALSFENSIKSYGKTAAIR